MISFSNCIFRVTNCCCFCLLSLLDCFHGKVGDTLKKSFPIAWAILIGLVAGILLSSALYAFTGFSLFGKPREQPLLLSDANNAELSRLAYSILEDIKAGDYRALSRAAHPELGVLFSPHATLDELANKRFSADEIAAFGTDTNVYVWGLGSDSGEPIEMTPSDYFAKYVFRKDYTTAPFVGINNVVRTGNALENMTDIFPDMQFVEFHIPGTEQNPTEDFDWCTLRLGFEEYNGSLRLAAVIYSKWSV